MKKVKILILILILTLSSTLFLVKVSAEEDTSSSDATIEDTVVENENTLTVGAEYTYFEEDKTFVFTIRSENEIYCNVFTDEDSCFGFLGNYTYENGLLTVIALDEEIGTFTIGENNILEVYDVPVVDNEDVVVDEEQRSELQIYLEENLREIVNFVVGMFTTIVSLAIFILKTKRKFDKITDVTNSQNKDTKDHLEKTKALVNETKQQNEIMKNKLDSFMEQSANTITSLTQALEATTKSNEALVARISVLEDVIELMSLHSKELVANGTAEKITKKIRG